MRHKFGKLIVISLGGSIMCPDGVDYRYLRNFKNLIESWLKRGKRFLIVPGGGRISRLYQEAGAKIAPITDDDKDWIGIHATRLNAHLLRTIFRKHADPVVFDERERIKKLGYPITIGSGWQPGWSTDYVSTALAADFHASAVINASRAPYVYDKDVMRFKNAKAFTHLTWKDYRKIIPSKWIPGSHYPVDPIAAKLAQKEGIAFVAIDGRNIKNFNNTIAGKDFKGTVIE
jgi:uridylate kinase